MIVLDTHIWVAFIDDPSSLSRKALTAIKEERGRAGIRISSISAWEILMLARKGRLAMKVPVDLWVEKCERLSFLTFVPVDNAIARLSVTLPDPLHRDPADRIIIATAVSLNATLITKDRKILDYPHVKTLS